MAWRRTRWPGWRARSSAESLVALSAVTPTLGPFGPSSLKYIPHQSISLHGAVILEAAAGRPRSARHSSIRSRSAWAAACVPREMAMMSSQ